MRGAVRKKTGIPGQEKPNEGRYPEKARFPGQEGLNEGSCPEKHRISRIGET